MNSDLAELLGRSASVHGGRTAVEDPHRDASITYDGLASSSDAVRDALLALGVEPGDRIGICAPKSIGVVASIFGMLKAGAAYVPVDSAAPAPRNASIFRDCSVRAMITDRGSAGALGRALGDVAIERALDLELAGDSGGDLVVLRGPGRDDERSATSEAGTGVSYILYTSGSTGQPKGVVHTHASALSFVDWCSETFEPTERDRFSSHAPFHFDLSILDIFVPLKHGATLVLFNEELGKIPARLAEVIAERRLSVWYSTPSVLRMLLDFGKLDRHDYSFLRLVLFAGEVFPIKYLRALVTAWPNPTYFNLYGPTETNVCTFYRIPDEIPVDRQDPYPIGRACSGDRTRVVDDAGREVAGGGEGELQVTGGSVMRGYFGMPERTREAFLTDGDGTRWYRTGDIVIEEPAGNYRFIGRRDRMVKRRGYRVELGEIESALYRHAAISEAAAIARTSEDGDVTITAFLSCTGQEPPSQVELKNWCARTLPLYMVPDRFSFLDSLPKTSTDKIDYQGLKRLTG